MTAEQLKAEESQYIAGVVPNFNTVFGDCSPPLKPSQKLNLVYHAIFVPFTIGLDIALAGADEIDGSHNGYGWGASGYFKRAGAEFADSADAEFIGNGLLPILLHQDPRYFQLGAGHPLAKRIWHAALSDFICRSDRGRTQFNTSNVIGNLITGTISNLYYPANERGVGLTVENAVKVTLEGSLGSQLLEFSPELTAFFQRIVHPRSHSQSPPP
jgi:hypothetical protein